MISKNQIPYSTDRGLYGRSQRSGTNKCAASITSGDARSNFCRTELIRYLERSAFAFIMILLAACGGSLSDEQRKKLHDGMEDHKITQVSDNEIVTAAMDKGRGVFDALEKSGFNAPVSQRIAKEAKVKVRFITPGASDALEVENQIIQAYIVGAVTGSTQDNIQKLRSGTSTSLQDYDTLLYSRPVVTSLPDGSVNVEGVWNIYVAKRDIVRSLSKK